MQPQPETPSPVEPPSDEAAAPEERSEQGTQVSSDQNWFRRLWRRGSPEPEPQDAPATTEVSDAVTLTQEEFDKRVQAEADRRESARNERARSDRRRKLRDENPWQYAEEDRNAEHDKYSLDPIVEALADADRKRILELEGAGQGLEGRKLIVTEGLKALEKQWKADGARDAEDRLRKNPAFRKQLLNEMRRSGVREPELISGTASSVDQSISNLLREQLRR